MDNKLPAPTLTFGQSVWVLPRIDEPYTYLCTTEGDKIYLIAYTREEDARAALDTLRLNDWCTVGCGVLAQLMLGRDGKGFRWSGLRLDQPMTGIVPALRQEK